MANEAAYKLREDERLREMALNRQNGCDECDLVYQVHKCGVRVEWGEMVRLRVVIRSKSRGWLRGKMSAVNVGGVG